MIPKRWVRHLGKFPNYPVFLSPHLTVTHSFYKEQNGSQMASKELAEWNNSIPVADVIKLGKVQTLNSGVLTVICINFMMSSSYSLSRQYYRVMTVMIVADSRAIDLMKIWQGAAINLPPNSFQTLLAFSHYRHR